MAKPRYSIIGFALFFIVMMGLLMGLYFFGITGIFELLGVQYQSVWSLLIFAVSFFILGLVIDLFFGSMGNATAEKLEGNTSKFVIQFLFGFVTNWIALVVVDVFIGSITLTLETKLIIAVLIAIFETVVSDKEIANKSKDS